MLAAFATLGQSKADVGQSKLAHVDERERDRQLQLLRKCATFAWASPSIKGSLSMTAPLQVTLPCSVAAAAVCSTNPDETCVHDRGCAAAC